MPSELSATQVQTGLIAVQALIIGVSAWIAGSRVLGSKIDIDSNHDLLSEYTFYEVVFLAGVLSFTWAFNDIVVYLRPSIEYLLYETLLLLRGVFVIGGLAISRVFVTDRWFTKLLMAGVLVGIFLMQGYYGIWMSS